MYVELNLTIIGIKVQISCMTYLAFCALCQIHRESGGIIMYASNYRAKLSNLPEISSLHCTASQQPGSHRQNTPLPKMQDQAEKAKRSHWKKTPQNIFQRTRNNAIILLK